MSRHGGVIRLRAQFLTIDWSAGLINQTVALNDAVGLLGLSPGHVDGTGGQLTEVDEAGSTRCFWGRKKKMKKINNERLHSMQTTHVQQIRYTGVRLRSIQDKKNVYSVRLTIKC